MQVSALVATGDAVQRDQGVALLGGTAQQNERLLFVRARQLAVLEHLIGPQAVFTTVARLTPEQRVAAVLLQGFARRGKGFIRRALARELISNRADLATAFNLAFDTQLVTDLAQTTHRIDALLHLRRTLIDDFAIDRHRQPFSQRLRADEQAQSGNRCTDALFEIHRHATL
ncbi:hypothetical protein D3C81_861700 [compost metagenome]